MSKIVCDICGTTYDDNAGACPVCGWTPGSDLDADPGDMDDILTTDLRFDEPEAEDVPEIPDIPPQKGKAAFDFDAVNSRRRPAPKPVPKPVQEEEEDDEEEEDESGSNKFLVFILVLLILALLAVTAYIGYTKFLKPAQKGDEDNRPQETVSAQVVDPTENGFGTLPTVEAGVVEDPTETLPGSSVEPVAPTVPCTELSLVASMEPLTFAGQYWRLMVKAGPENTTDKVTFTSGDESVVTIDENGRVTAVGEGETVIVIACGDKRIETPAVVRYAESAASTTPTTGAQAAPVEGTSGSGTGAGATVATPSGGVLKLRKTDVTIGRKGVYITLELENGISADSVTWSTSDSSIATVWNGNVTAIGRGTCVIRAEYNGQVAECVVRCRW